MLAVTLVPALWPPARRGLVVGLLVLRRAAWPLCGGVNVKLLPSTLLPAMHVPIAIWPMSLFVYICSLVFDCSTGGKICIHVVAPVHG